MPVAVPQLCGSVCVWLGVKVNEEPKKVLTMT